MQVQRPDGIHDDVQCLQKVTVRNRQRRHGFQNTIPAARQFNNLASLIAFRAGGLGGAVRKRGKVNAPNEADTAICQLLTDPRQFFPEILLHKPAFALDFRLHMVVQHILQSRLSSDRCQLEAPERSIVLAGRPLIQLRAEQSQRKGQ